MTTLIDLISSAVGKPASGYEVFHTRVDEAMKQMQKIRRLGTNQVVLKPKIDSHVFRPKFKENRALNLRHFTRVIHVNLEDGWIDVEGMISYHDLVESLMPLGYMPKIVPEFRSITVGGAISGVGVEATSFKHGLVHETVREMDVLTGNGDVLRCTEDNEHSELFHGMPNSYGVLGYILRARVEIMPMKPYVQVTHEQFSSPELAFKRLKEASGDHSHDFVEGVVYRNDDLRVLTGRLVSEPPKAYELQDFRIRNRFFESVRDEFDGTEYMSTLDFLWRWDADLFWGTRDTILENKFLRRLVGESVLRSDRLLKLIRSFIEKEGDVNTTLIQDIGIPASNWGEYFDWYCENVNQFPMWLCTVSAKPTPLFKISSNEVYCDFGSFDVKFPDSRSYRDSLNQMEKKMLALGGIKCFYADNALSEDDFFRIVGKEDYLRLKGKYDSSNVLPGLFEKCVKVCDPQE